MSSDPFIRSFLLLALIGAVDAAAAGPGTASEIERTIEMSPEDKLTYAQEAIGEVASSLAEMEQIMGKARNGGDTQGVDFLIPRVAALKALLRVANGALQAMTEALAAGETARADHEFRKIAVAVGKTRVLLAEAQRQSAEQDLESGNTSLQWQDQFVEGDTFGEPEIDDMDVSIDPPQVSPYY